MLTNKQLKAIKLGECGPEEPHADWTVGKLNVVRSALGLAAALIFFWASKR